MTTKVFDTFNGADGTDLVDHIPDTDVVGGGWLQSTANELELDGAGALKLNSAGKQGWIDVGTTNQWCISNFRGASSTGVNNQSVILLRRDNSSLGVENAYAFEIKPELSTGTLKLAKRVSGLRTELAATTGFAMDSITDYSLECEINGSALDFIIDGVSRLSLSDSSITTGNYAGFHSGLRIDATMRHYDFQIDDAAPVVGGINVFRRRMIMRKSA